jgi:hypothetical protein
MNRPSIGVGASGLSSRLSQSELPARRARDRTKVSDLQRSVLQRFAPEPDFSTPQLLRATAHDARRQGRACKQRGSRNVRWAA